ncbi:MAG: IS1634 family transposase [Elusimicrobia bacterium]|nr:IS1634 family transposase [Elusimicrobiota bacterium]
MAYLITKTIRGRKYYYLARSQRVNGIPRIVWQKYIGTAADVAQRLQTHHSHIKEVDVFEFGACAALWQIAKKLDLPAIIDRHAGKRDQGVSVGTYMTVAAINRCVAPTSKRSISHWYRRCALRRLLGVSPSRFSSQRFWDHMDYLDEDKILAIGKDLTKQVQAVYGLQTNTLLYDTTNFFTFLSPYNPSDLARHGKNKQHRDDLRQVGLALLVSRDGQIPLFHWTYRGNLHDAKVFPVLVEKLNGYLKDAHFPQQDLTLVYDKGNNSKNNQAVIESSPFHFVGSLVPFQHQDLLEIPLPRYRKCSQPDDVTAFRASKKIMNVEYTVVLTFSPKRRRKDLHDFQAMLQKRLDQLKEAQRMLAKKPSARRSAFRRTDGREGAVRKLLAKITQARYLSQVLKVDFRKTGPGEFHLSHHVDQKALRRLTQQIFGKTILYTDRHDWDTDAIVQAYRGLRWIELAFKQMKDPHFVSWSPRLHWTDSKIRVHAFYCVLALTLANLLKRELASKGHRLELDTTIEQLSQIRETLLLPAPTKGSGLILSRLSPLQKKLYGDLNLQELRGA